MSSANKRECYESICKEIKVWLSVLLFVVLFTAAKNEAILSVNVHFVVLVKVLTYTLPNRILVLIVFEIFIIYQYLYIPRFRINKNK